MNSLLRLALVFLGAASVNAFMYEVTTTYTDSACTNATGGFYVKRSTIGPDVCDPYFPTCSKGEGIYLKSVCTSTDPLLNLAPGTNILYEYPSSDSICLTNDTVPYKTALVAPIGVCVADYVTQNPSKFMSCSGTANITEFVDYTTCVASTSAYVLRTNSYTANTCALSGIWDIRVVCASAAPVAAPTTGTAPTAAPTSGSQTPTRKSSDTSSSAAGLAMIGIALIVLV